METCSRCRGIRVHDPVETPFTMAWNTHQVRRRWHLLTRSSESDTRRGPLEIVLVGTTQSMASPRSTLAGIAVAVRRCWQRCCLTVRKLTSTRGLRSVEIADVIPVALAGCHLPSRPAGAPGQAQVILGAVQAAIRGNLLQSS